MAEYDRSATGPLPVDAGPRRAESIFDMSPADFRASLGEMQALGHDTDALMRQYRARNSIFAPINNAAAAQAQDLADSGRSSVLGGLLSKPEGATGLDAVRGLEREGWRGLLGAGQQVGQAIDAPAAAYQGLIPQADVNMEALNTAGLAMGAGGAATAPSGALRSGLARGAGFDDIKAAFPDVRIDIGGSPETGFTLGKIIVPEGGRGAGVGTQVMEAITRRADELGGQVNLTPSADFGGNVGRLRDFYARQGFVRNTGRNRDFSTQEDMYRTAQANASQSGGLLGAGLAREVAESPAQGVARLLREGRASEVTDDMLARLSPNDNAELFRMYDEGATGMDLPMDQASRLARADSGGFDTGTPLYHGAREPFDSFTPSERGFTGPGVYTTPIADDASGYAMDHGVIGQNGLEVYGPSGRFIDERDYSKAVSDTPNEGDALSYQDRQGLASAELQSQGVNGVDVSIVSPQRFDDSGLHMAQRAIFDPSNIRSTNARFDPRLSSNANLLAANASQSGGLLGAGLSEAQRQARDILDMRAAGNARSVTDDMMARADDQYMFGNTPLPMNEASRLARARDGGFDTGTPLYHGGDSGISAMDPDVASGKDYDTGVWTTSDPYNANRYAGSRTEGVSQNVDDLGSVYPLLADTSGYGITDFRGRNWGDAPERAAIRGGGQPYQEISKIREDWASWPYTGEAVRAARDTGRTGLDIRNVVDIGDQFPHKSHIGLGDETASSVVAIDPTTLRSRFARFDPEFSHLSNLSAANASPTAGLLAMQQEQDKPLPFMEMLRGLLR
jgi:GNAT superfamily N-acetyltransferase